VARARAGAFPLWDTIAKAFLTSSPYWLVLARLPAIQTFQGAPESLKVPHILKDNVTQVARDALRVGMLEWALSVHTSADQCISWEDLGTAMAADGLHSLEAKCF
jgi:hypothetical protein